LASAGCPNTAEVVFGQARRRDICVIGRCRGRGPLEKEVVRLRSAGGTGKISGGLIDAGDISLLAVLGCWTGRCGAAPWPSAVATTACRTGVASA
jgi:hypothetical protein